jgi:hypothetical protein
MANASDRARKGLRLFLDEAQQQAWLDGTSQPEDAAAREQSFEHRLRYAGRFAKLRARPQAPEVFAILARYGETCLPVPRATERYFWSVSCLPSTSDKPLVRVNASWMELFTLLPDGDGLRARFILHLSDFTDGGAVEFSRLDLALLEDCAAALGRVTCVQWDHRDVIVVRVRGADAIAAFLAQPHALRAIRRFNLTHMNRGRNAYQASHSYAVADYMIGEADPVDDAAISGDET